MSNRYPGVTKSVALVERLKGALSEFAARENKVNRAYYLESSKQRTRYEEAIAEHETELKEKLGVARQSLQRVKDRIVAQFEARRARIARAYKTSKDRVLAETSGREGRRKISLQKSAIELSRGRDADLANADKDLKEFAAALAKDRDSLEALRIKARRTFGPYGKFAQRLAAACKAEAEAQPGAAKDENDLAAELRALLASAGEEVAAFRRLFLPGLFRIFPAPLIGGIVVASLAILTPLLQNLGYEFVTYGLAGGAMAALLVVVCLLHFNVKRKAEPVVASVVDKAAKAGRLCEVCAERAETNHREKRDRITSSFEAQSRELEEQWIDAESAAAQILESRPEQIDRQARRLTEKNEEIHRLKMESLEPGRGAATASHMEEAEQRKGELTRKYEQQAAELKSNHEAEWERLEADWKNEIGEFYAEIKAAAAAADALFPEWSPALWENWSPPAEFEHAGKFARMDVDPEALSDSRPSDKRLALPEPSAFSLPLLLALPEEGSILIETAKTGHDEAIGALNNIILRLLSTAPPGRLSFTIIDPVGLGENFAGVMHLADYEDHLINSRIWTQSAQIEERLRELNEHMEKVIQMYLRNEYETITQYNLKAGNIAEKYHFLVVADFPSGFSEIAIKRLLSIASSGARCGVYTLIHWDRRQEFSQGFVADDLRKSSVWISCNKNECAIADKPLRGARVVLDAPPDPEFAIDFINRVGRSSVDSNRVEVPFDQVIPPEADFWKGDTTSELRVPIGRTGATKLQYLAIGKGTRQHALIAGKTGSGKSTLFHVMITNLALWCSPDQVEFYLVDFKKGVEFKAYAAARLPHARVIAIESDREFGLSVLQRVDAELKRRGDMFRDLGVQDIAGYKKAGGTEPVPRSLLLIDEFQEFFVEDDRISQNAAVLLDRIVRQGRAFGIHVILGSQTLGGAFTLARTTLGQMVIRIALQCNEADSYLIMDDSNPAPRLLTRPGEGIYNDNAGMLEGNSPFQVVWLPDEVREKWLGKVRELAKQSPNGCGDPIVFEGNVPADIRENTVLRELLAAESVERPVSPRAWLGSPNSIKGPTEAVFHRQSGNNLLVVGQRDEAALAILSVALVSLAAQYPRDGARFALLDGSAPGSPQRDFIESVAEAMPHEIDLVKGGDIAEFMSGLANEMRARSEEGYEGDGRAIFVFVHGVQRFKKLRYEEDFSFSSDDGESAAKPCIEFDNLIRDGASHGIHVIATVDTYNNVTRFLSRKAVSEFEMRVLFQMSANDSASLIDTPKASTLGLNRALFYNEQEGYLETFRPYALPGDDWIREAAGSLARLHGSAV